MALNSSTIPHGLHHKAASVSLYRAHSCSNRQSCVYVYLPPFICSSLAQHTEKKHSRISMSDPNAFFDTCSLQASMKGAQGFGASSHSGAQGLGLSSNVHVKSEHDDGDIPSAQPNFAPPNKPMGIQPDSTQQREHIRSEANDTTTPAALDMNDITSSIAERIQAASRTLVHNRSHCG